ncbi:MAG TPA: hypothetical protein DCG06_01475 [Deltaproteobacteria bacterium]|nr:hypothetical protein [Deltaproteobacteria bacterium]
MQNRLIFLVGAPRSGTTLLARILSAHSEVASRAEPHLITPLAHLGYFGSVQKAPYDPFNVQQAIQELVSDLPGGEEDYLTALRAYTDSLYGAILEQTPDKKYFLDKTPANSLVLPFLTKLYPQAGYIVLTRHPLAILSSYVNSFFDGDYQVAMEHNPILQRYVPALARMLREKPVPFIPIRYEDFVADPEAGFRKICEHLDISFESAAINYQEQSEEFQGLGDPIGVGQHDRPVTSSIKRWAVEIATNPQSLAQVLSIVDQLEDEDLEILGYPRAQILDDLNEAASSGTKPAKRSRPLRYTLERKLLIGLRRNIHKNVLGRVLKKLQFALDVILRD